MYSLRTIISNRPRGTKGDVKMQKYTLEDLAQRYRLSKSSMSEYLKEHRTEIDPEEQHIMYRGGRFYFLDEVALAALDNLRKYQTGITPADVLEREETERTLQQQILNLQTALAAANAEAKNAYKELAETRKQYLEDTHTLALESATAKAEARAVADEKNRLNEKLETAQIKIGELQGETQTAQAKIAQMQIEHQKDIEQLKKTYGNTIGELKNELQTEQGKTWWQKLLGK